MTTTKIGIVYCDDASKAKALSLADQLDLPLCYQQPHCDWDFFLAIQSDYIELAITSDKTIKPLKIDYLHGPIAYRLQHSGSKQALARAIGLKSHYRPTIVDATAGLGRDAFILATLGCKVTALERSPIIFTLLNDGIIRAKLATQYQQLMLTCLQANASDYLSHLSTSDYPEVIYLDPMFAEHQGNALVKKEMRILRDIVGADNDSHHLFETAIKHAKKRVVVKRHNKNNYLADKKPSYSLTGKTNRFDIYLTT